MHQPKTVVLSGWAGRDFEDLIVTSRYDSHDEAQEALLRVYMRRHPRLSREDAITEMNSGKCAYRVEHFHIDLTKTAKPRTKAGKEEAYWRQAMAVRMPFHEELVRLETLLHGFYSRSPEHEKEGSVIDFLRDAKRPFGNKNVAQSIIYNLGWDFERRLCRVAEPGWVTDQARMLYHALINEMEEEKTA